MSQDSFDHLHAPRAYWWLAFGAGALTLVCGTAGFLELKSQGAAVPSSYSWSVAVYSALQMLVLQTPLLEKTNVWIEIGRWTGAFTLVAGSLLLLWRRLRREFLHWRHGSRT